MLEGQMGLNWERFTRIARAVEDLGFAGLFRSDHFTNPAPPDTDSLELIVSLTWLASNTSRIHFGPLVSPVSFRDPVMLTRQIAALSDLSGGRAILGLGAGWQEREHRAHGYDLLDVRSRMDRLDEGMRVATLLLRGDGPQTFEGRFFSIRDAELLPRPSHHVPILLGGNGPKRSHPIAARYADIWNGFARTPDGYRQICAHLDELLAAADRKPGDLRRTMMTRAPQGEASEVRGVLEDLEAGGVQEVMFQWLDLDDLDGLADLAKVAGLEG